MRRALEEDLGRAGDLTCDAVFTPDITATGQIVARKPGRLAGLEPALAAFTLLDPGFHVEAVVVDGALIQKGQILAHLSGAAATMLTAERTALNILGHLCGVATTTGLMVDLVKDHPARIVCTRKTLPGLRALQKYAVRAGGGYNHRFGLDDAVMIKDNHIAICGSITAAVARVREHIGHMVKIEVEVDTLEQFEELLKTDADVVLLDNMSPETLGVAVSMNAGKMVTEASGSITPDTVAAVAASGVDYISAGFITHSAPNLDVGLDIQTN